MNNDILLALDLTYWKNREKQFLEFYEQMDQQIGNYLFITKSPNMDMYRQIIESGVTGYKSLYLYYYCLYDYIFQYYLYVFFS